MGSDCIIAGGDRRGVTVNKCHACTAFGGVTECKVLEIRQVIGCIIGVGRSYIRVSEWTELFYRTDFADDHDFGTETDGAVFLHIRSAEIRGNSEIAVDGITGC